MGHILVRGVSRIDDEGVVKRCWWKGREGVCMQTRLMAVLEADYWISNVKAAALRT